jgi:hypothetical protein
LTRTDADILHRLRVIGNSAAHEIKPATQAQVAAAMKVIDHLLIGAYVLPNEAMVLPAPDKKGGSTCTAAPNSPSPPVSNDYKSPPAATGEEP